VPVSVAAALASLWLGACAAAPAADAGPVSVRIVVKLVRASEDGAAIAAEASRVAGVPVAYAAAVSPFWHALGLRCADAPACDAAMARLRAASGVYESVEVDGRKKHTAS
jgi:hypothetical protein